MSDSIMEKGLQEGIDVPIKKRPHAEAASKSIRELIQSNPNYSWTDIRQIIGKEFPRERYKFITNKVFEWLLQKIGNDLVRPNLSEMQANNLYKQGVVFSQKQLEERGMDPLTGLPDRRLFQELFEENLKFHKKWTFLLIDIDCFKQFNTDFLHEGGDKALRALAYLIKIVAYHGKHSLCCRWGGEEMLAAIPATINPDNEKLTDLQEAYRLFVEAIFGRVGSFSGGLVQHDFSQDETITWQDLVNRADEALDNVKNTGKGRIELWTPQTPHKPTSAIKQV